MISVRVKLFSKNKKKKDSNDGKVIYHDFGELSKERSKFPEADTTIKTPKQKSSAPKEQINKTKSSTTKTDNRTNYKNNTGENKTTKPKTQRSRTTTTKAKVENNKFQDLAERYKKDPDFKKKVNTGGFITLGTALTAGAVLGGAKLIKDKKRELSNERVKNSILIKDEEKGEE